MRVLVPLLLLVAGAMARSRDLPLAPGQEGLNISSAVDGDDLPDYLTVVAARQNALSPGSAGLEDGANGLGSGEEDGDMDEKYEVVAVKRSALSPGSAGLEDGANEEGSGEDDGDMDEKYEVVLAKRISDDTLVDGYEYVRSDMLTPPQGIVKRDDEDKGHFNIADLVDVDTLQEQFSSKFSTDPNDGKAARDIPGQALNPEDFFQADMVEEMTMDFNQQDPLLSAGLFEGDIANVANDALKGIMGWEDRNRNAIRDSWRRWPDATIPYVISSEFSQHERSVIAKAMQNYHAKTCIRFRPRTSEKAYIHIMKGSGCSSSVGRTGSRQTVSLGNGCVYAGIVMHELMHASGFWHEQSRADRDEYVKINWENIMTGMEYNFLKYNLNKITHLDATYDTCSVMHYGSSSFSKQWGKKTIVSRHKHDKCELGQRKGFSDTDIRKLNTLYKCKGYPQVGGTGAITATPKPTTKPAVVKPTCEDGNKFCDYWAKNDECLKNPEWMLTGCPVSCNQCKIKCDDNNVYCKDWAKLDECDKNPDYMNIYCAKSCKKCVGDCEDENKTCGSWAKKGYCKSGDYTNYMKLRCKASCKLC